MITPLKLKSRPLKSNIRDAAILHSIEQLRRTQGNKPRKKRNSQLFKHLKVNQVHSFPGFGSWRFLTAITLNKRLSSVRWLAFKGLDEENLSK